MAQQPRNRAARDVIQRAYLLKHLQRKHKEWNGAYGCNPSDVIDQLIRWVKAQRSRSKKAGGL